MQKTFFNLSIIFQFYTFKTMRKSWVVPAITVGVPAITAGVSPSRTHI